MGTRIHHTQIDTTNSPTDGKVLSYNGALQRMEWITVSGGGVNFTPGSGLLLDGDILHVDQTFNFNWTGNHTFSNDIIVEGKNLLRYMFLLGVD